MEIATRKRPPTAPRVDFAGTWENELGSTMVLDIDPEGRVNGRYWSAVGEARRDEGFELVGFASGDLLSFTVDFGRYGSLTSWVGQHARAPKGEIVKTTWLLARDVADPTEPERLWSATLTGTDTFHRR